MYKNLIYAHKFFYASLLKQALKVNSMAISPNAIPFDIYKVKLFEFGIFFLCVRQQEANIKKGGLKDKLFDNF